MTPTGVKLTDAEWETVRKVVHDWGLYEEYHLATYAEVDALQQKLNTDELDKDE